MKDELTFPLETELRYNLGLTKREYFAACALQGFCAYSYPTSDEIEVYASKAYELADAMMKAREK